MSDTRIRLPEVLRRTRLPRSEVYRRINEGTFPKQRRVSHRRADWSGREVDEWADANGVAPTA